MLRTYEATTNVRRDYNTVYRTSTVKDNNKIEYVKTQSVRVTNLR